MVPVDDDPAALRLRRESPLPWLLEAAGACGASGSRGGGGGADGPLLPPHIVHPLSCVIVSSEPYTC